MKIKVSQRTNKEIRRIGFLGMMVDPKYGGAGMDTISYVLAMEEISKSRCFLFCDNVSE